MMTNFQTVTAETVSILHQWNNVVCHLGGLLVNMPAGREQVMPLLRLFRSESQGPIAY